MMMPSFGNSAPGFPGPRSLAHHQGLVVVRVFGGFIERSIKYDFTNVW